MNRAALFDVDGTLVDTNHLHVVCWWEALRQGGHDVAMHDIHRAIGLPGEDLLARLLGEHRDTSEDDTLSAAHSTLYGTYFDRLPPLHAAADLLRELDRRGWRVVLVTSATDDELDALRRAVGADDAITATASSEDVTEGKPEPEPLHHALGLADAAARDSVFVGDTVWDMEAGSRAHVACVGLLCGGIPRRDLEEAGARAVYRNPADLLAHVGNSPFADRRRPPDPTA
ncbi:haloacid dehalogenase [Streptomyces nojiriensis]|uniref:Haloacid dehalogenase n=1 Tax=Streptomyces nojiriensis TaxID=66374 RepID=A0ABQ3SN27_9ACTN|nr:HAD family hydrolase [Streptomyces nojiriensis]QTI43098.1 Validoxylamine A 7'-phosphate phosphatase [Streptomyces nojiriensis]GGS30881.1 haloacid dehalogenase [Streptomyces nojiriensis]GHI69534.1 haloacid dehalogenase [Streptomyces nojiriensis]